MTEIPIAVRKIKISVPVRAEALPGVPLDGPIGDLQLKLALEGSSFAIPARINGKSYRRMLRTVAEKGAENVAVILQGDLMVQRFSRHRDANTVQLYDDNREDLAGRVADLLGRDA
jgi:integrase